MVRSILASLAALVLVAGNAGASSCPVLDSNTRGCQETVAKAGALYAKGAVKAIQRCLQNIKTGTLSGDPNVLCLADPPGDPTTATAVSKAETKATGNLAKKCDDTEVAALQLCGATVPALGACLIDDHHAHIAAALGAAYGAVTSSPDKGQQKCQGTIGKETGKLVTARLKSVQRCLNSRNKTTCGGPDALARCLAPRADSASSLELTLLNSLAKAELKFRDKIAKGCDDTQVAALDTCGETESDASDCLVCVGGNASDLLVGEQYRTVRVADSGTTMQAAANAAETEDTILVEPGTYVEEVELKDSGLTVRGLKECTSGQRPLVLPPSPASQNGIFWCGSRLGGGCLNHADNVLLKSLEVNNFDENDVFTVGVVGVTYDDMVTRGPSTAGVTRYGLFPILSDGVLIENCLASGISDAALYVGQSINIIVRFNEVHSSVAGIEIENSANAEVHNNYAHDNAGGILVFKLAGLPVQSSDCHYVHDNTSVNNNGPNYGEGIVGTVPSGTGMLMLSTDTTIFENNTITGNKSIGMLFIDQEALNALIDPDPFPTPSPDQDVNDNALRGNILTGNAYDQDPGTAGLGADLMMLPFFRSGNCQDSNTYGTVNGAAGFTGPCPATINPRPGCPFVEPPSTTTTTTTTTVPSTTTTTLVWTWSGEVQPLLSTRCAACHGNAGTPQYAGLSDLDDPVAGYNEIVNVASSQLPSMDRVEPNDHMLSYLWHKVNGSQAGVGGAGGRMPAFCDPGTPGSCLSAEEIAGIAGWIDAGAQND
jgi:parallel beta-helix repeat protein